MATPFLSIITINYNQAEGLRKTIASVASQTYIDFEFIIIDGHSTDKSVEVIEQNKDHIDYWVSEPDSGIYNAMNKGIKIAQGQYLLFLNSGDALTESNALGNFINHSQFHGDIIYGDYQFQEGHKVYPDVLPTNYFMKTSLPHQSTFFKKSVFERMGFYDESYKIGADRAFYIKCFADKSIVFQHIPYFLTLFDLSGLSNDSEYTEKKRQEDARMFYEFYGSKYDDYKEQLKQEAKQKRAKRNSLKGILKRIVNRIKKI
ncbi:glycosyltransferase [Aureisphaera sp. CAU 1614]|uniref:Glycosyltransferase n=1 Tax=Halomarinibacterium sedimenti TaxID=2857106 RepID=A0A9X1JVG5_9FLAO|nr:glycosyltransferase family 2 protein [Halomarinibacterium sedimenti]MBW2937715.1 glycosyltransferase [Halomarinibacterium sedimenti]